MPIPNVNTPKQEEINAGHIIKLLPRQYLPVQIAVRRFCITGYALSVDITEASWLLRKKQQPDI